MTGLWSTHRWSSSRSLGMLDCRKGSTKGLTGKVVNNWSCRRNSGTEILPATRLTTFLLTPAPTTAEMPSLKLIRVIRNFLTFSVSALLLSEVGVVKSEKPVMPSPLLTDMPTALLGITLWVGGTGTVHTDTGVVILLQYHGVISLSSLLRSLSLTWPPCSSWKVLPPPTRLHLWFLPW